MEEWLFDDPDSNLGRPDHYWTFISHLYDDFRRWPALWFALRPYGTLADALEQLDKRGVGYRWDRSNNSTWDFKVQLYYFVGRHATFNGPAEKRLRRELFDYLSLPVVTYGAPAYRVLIPKDALGC